LCEGRIGRECDKPTEDNAPVQHSRHATDLADPPSILN
jgi:hypothetical protein